MTVLEVRRLGRTRFEDAHLLQRELVERRADDEIGDVLVLTEHEPVITVGRGADVESLGELGILVVVIERGGEATYHGPGQLVAYPTLKLPEGRRDLHRYLRDLEEVVIGVLAELDVAGSRRAGLTGVWIGERKVCSIGVAVRRWVTYHGLALNLHTDLAAFRRFRPCGLDPEVMTRVADYAELPPTNLLGEVLLVKHFCRVFGFELPPWEPPAPPAVEGPGYRPLPVL
jgi:lipoyl(octanoyl) transferase